MDKYANAGLTVIGGHVEISARNPIAHLKSVTVGDLRHTLRILIVSRGQTRTQGKGDHGRMDRGRFSLLKKGLLGFCRDCAKRGPKPHARNFLKKCFPKVFPGKLSESLQKFFDFGSDQGKFFCEIRTDMTQKGFIEHLKRNVQDIFTPCLHRNPGGL